MLIINRQSQKQEQPIEKLTAPRERNQGRGRYLCRGKGCVTMMDTKSRIFAPQINVSLDDLVPQDHFYRYLDQKLDLSFVRSFVEQSCAQVITTGQNLKRLLQKRGWGRRPSPAAAVSAVPHPDWQDAEQQRDSALRRKGIGLSTASIVSLSVNLRRLETNTDLFSCVLLIQLLIHPLYGYPLSIHSTLLLIFHSKGGWGRIESNL